MISGAIHEPMSCKAWAKVAIVRSSGVVSSQVICVGWSIKFSPILAYTAPARRERSSLQRAATLRYLMTTRARFTGVGMTILSVEMTILSG